MTVINAPFSVATKNDAIACLAVFRGWRDFCKISKRRKRFQEMTRPGQDSDVAGLMSSMGYCKNYKMERFIKSPSQEAWSWATSEKLKYSNQSVKIDRE